MAISKKILFLSLGFLFLISIEGCKSDEDDSPTDPTPTSLAGTWVLTKITIANGASSIILTPAQAQIESTIIAKADGTYTSTLVISGVTTTESGTYTVAGNKITFIRQDGTITTTDFTLTGNKLVVSQTVPTQFGVTPADLEFTKQ